jgi:uncharacterized protein (DUF1501 family)
MALSRREFFCQGVGAFGAAALALERFGLLKALAQATDDYRALVCIFLYGGNDSNNLVIPLDGYAEYAAARAGTGLQIPQEQLLPIAPPSHGARFGLHPSLAGLHELWLQQKLAVVCNIGPLLEPTTRETYRNGTAQRPLNLFSHSDQQAQWQTAIADSTSATGWGGRLADSIAGLHPPDGTFPMIVSVAGVPIFTTGTTAAARPLTFPPDIPFRLDGFPASPDSDPRYRAVLDLLQADGHMTLVRGVSDIITQALDNTQTLATLPALTTTFPGTPLGSQLRQVAQLIKLNQSTLGLSRQLFFCALGGFDTHNNQVVAGNPTTGTHASLLAQVSGAMRAFYAATVELGLVSQVTTFTLSDFGRTFKPNGGLGTDHGWGSHHFVMGGAVRGSDFYGTFPPLVLGDGIDTDDGGEARGRWIPTTAVDQYGATLCAWFGIPAADIPAVFPNIGRFETSDLGFLGT